MQFLLLIYENEALRADRSDAQNKAIFNDYMEFTKGIVQSGHFKAGDALQPVKTAKTVRVRDGKTLATDGPFAETREQLGGYYLIEAKDMEEAMAIGARVPVSKVGSLEVRPIMQMDMKS